MKGLRILIFESLVVVSAVYATGYLINRQATPSYFAAMTIGMFSPLVLPQNAYSKAK